jgi:hypothetical protein
MSERNRSDSLRYSDIPQDSLGMHFCGIYRNEEELLSVSIPYLLYGLEYNQRCLYIADKELQLKICSELDKTGIRTIKYIESGHFIFLTKEESYLLAGYFSPFRMIDQIEYSHYETLKKGYGGLRGAGEMGWALENFPGSDKLIDYENQINVIFPNKRMSVVCFYNETKFPEDVLLNVLYAHPKAIIYGKTYNNPHYIPPEKFANAETKNRSSGEYQQIRDSIINQI